MLSQEICDPCRNFATVEVYHLQQVANYLQRIVKEPNYRHQPQLNLQFKVFFVLCLN